MVCMVVGINQCVCCSSVLVIFLTLVSFLSKTDITVIQGERGDYFYADLDIDGKMIPSEGKVGVLEPRADHPKNLRNRLESVDCNHFLCPDEIPKGAHQQQEILLDDESSGITLRRRKLSPTGILKNLVVLMRFQDHLNKDLPSREMIDILFNGDDQACFDNANVCGNSGSVKSYWKKFSHGHLEIETTVAEWVTVPFSEVEAADNNHG
jgi:hypothetical protein